VHFDVDRRGRVEADGQPLVAVADASVGTNAERRQQRFGAGDTLHVDAVEHVVDPHRGWYARPHPRAHLHLVGDVVRGRHRAVPARDLYEHRPRGPAPCFERGRRVNGRPVVAAVRLERHRAAP